MPCDIDSVVTGRYKRGRSPYWILLSQIEYKSEELHSTSEKEVLALVMALQHLDFYLTPAQFPMKTDHNSLVFNKEQESMSVALKLITVVI